MKRLCIYDLAITLPAPNDWRTVEAAQEAFDEHDKAQSFFGFKVAVTELFQIALAGISYGTPATYGGMAITLLGYLTGPESERRFLFVETDNTIPAFLPIDDALSPHRPEPDILDLYADLQQLLGWCLHNYPGATCYASLLDEPDNAAGAALVASDGTRIPIIQSCYEWGELYRQFHRHHPARLLPNAFIDPSDSNSIFAFCPPKDFLEDNEDLPHPRLPERDGWRNVGGNHRGYPDRWGNFWMWNSRRGHWDVQITHSMQQSIGAPDSHLNVECAGQYRNNALLEGRIVEGYQPPPNVISKFSIWKSLPR